MTASLGQRDGAGCPRGAGGEAEDAGGILGQLDEFAGRISRTQVFESAANGQQLIGRLLPRVTYQTCFAVDSNPWTHQELGSYSQLLGKVGKVFQVFGL
jgi:hypothetical protein